MRKLVLILLAFIAALTFIRAFDTADGAGHTDRVNSELVGGQSE
jgi:hypothetical protein